MVGYKLSAGTWVNPLAQMHLTLTDSYFGHCLLDGHECAKYGPSSTRPTHQF